MSTPKILVTRRWPQETLDRVAQVGDVTFRDPDTTMSHDEFMAAAREYDVIMPTVSDKIPAEFYPAAKGKVKILASYGVGYNHIDVDAARANDIAVTNTPRRADRLHRRSGHGAASGRRAPHRRGRA